MQEKEDLSFRLVSPMSDRDPSSAVLENPYYTAVVSYVRDFAEDRRNGCIERRRTIVDCKPKDRKLMPRPVLAGDGTLYVSLSDLPDSVTGRAVPLLASNLAVAKSSGELLERALMALLFPDTERTERK